MKASEQGVTLRDQLPSRRVAALYLPEHRLVRSGKGVGCKQSGRAWSLLSSWDRAAEVRRRRIHSLPPCPSCPPGTRTCGHSYPPSATAPWPAGDATAMQHRERARTRDDSSAQVCKRAAAPACFIPPTNPNPSPHPHPNPSPSPSPGRDTGQAAPQPRRARHRSNPLRGSKNACLA